MDKILSFDIETAPNLAYVWGKYEQDVIAYQREWYMLSWSAKWLNGKCTTKGLIDYKSFTKNKEDDKELVTELWELFNQADILIAHNGDSFDIKKTNTRFLELGLPPPEPYKTIDTKKLAKRSFGFNSNKLDDLGRRLGVGQKLHTGGFDLWLGCMKGDLKSWYLMKKYNRQDVILLEKIYLKLRPWGTHPPVTQSPDRCPVCKGTLHKRGLQLTRKGQYQRYQCTNCAHWTQGPKIHEKSRQPIPSRDNSGQRSSDQKEILKGAEGTRRTLVGKTRDASEPGGRTDRWPDVRVYD